MLPHHELSTITSGLIKTHDWYFTVAKVILPAENLPLLPEAHPSSLGCDGEPPCPGYLLDLTPLWSPHNLYLFTCMEMHTVPDGASVKNFTSLSLQALWWLFI